MAAATEGAEPRGLATGGAEGAGRRGGAEGALAHWARGAEPQPWNRHLQIWNGFCSPRLWSHWVIPTLGWRLRLVRNRRGPEAMRAPGSAR